MLFFEEADVLVLEAYKLDVAWTAGEFLLVSSVWSMRSIAPKIWDAIVRALLL